MIVVDGGPVANLSGTSLAARPELAGVVLKDVTRPFMIKLLGGGKITGTIQDRVVRESGGTLDFYYRVFNDASSTGTGPLGTNIPNIEAVIRRNIPVGISSDVDWRTDGLGEIAPTTSSRGGQTAVGFSFATTLKPGDESRFFFVKTNAKSYNAKGNVTVSGGVDIGDITIITTFQPVKQKITGPLPLGRKGKKTNQTKRRQKPASSKSKQSKRSSRQKTRMPRRPSK